MMASGWSKLKQKLHDRDLDDEFEKFLNESLSDESATSPRRSLTPQSSKSKLLTQQKNLEKPWWATSEEEDSSLAKPKHLPNEELKTSLPSTKDSIDYTSRPGTALDTILSEPEYSSQEEKKKSTESSQGKIQKDDLSELSGDGLASNYEQQLPVIPIESSTDNAIGFETLEEIQDKEAFFSDIEKNGDVDYRELNQHYDDQNNGSANVGIVGLTPYRPPYYDEDEDHDDDDNDDHHDDDDNDDHHDDDDNDDDHDDDDNDDDHEDDDNDDDHDDNYKETKHETIKTSGSRSDGQQQDDASVNLLSKVALMESLETTGGFSFPQKLKKSNKDEQDSTVLQSGVMTAEILPTVTSQQAKHMMLFTEVTGSMLIVDKDESHQSNIDLFHLQPVVSNFIEEPRVIDSCSFVNQESSNQLAAGGEADADAGRGFGLQPISTIVLNEERNISPPTESLKSIKSIAEERKKKVGGKSKAIPPSSTIKTKKTPSHTMIKKSPTHTMKKRPSVSCKSNMKVASKLKDTTDSVIQTQNLISSVESFASYLKTVSSPGRHTTDSSQAATSNLEWRISNLQREKMLQTQLQELRVKYEEERENNQRLVNLLETQNQNFEKEKVTLSFQYEKQIKSLEEQVFVLKNKLEVVKDTESADVKENTTKEVELLHRQLEQQESLLNGYQVENEKLYSNIKKTQSENKKLESKMFSENQLLLTQISNLKEELEVRPNIDSSKNSAALGANRIVQLENQVKYYQHREIEHKEVVITLENEVASLKRKFSTLPKHSASPANDLMKQMEILKSTHQAEVERLHKRLKWYADNQDLVDKHLSEIRAKREEVKELRELVDRFENENQKLRKESKDRKGEKTNDFKRIQDLQRQVKEMEDIIRKRHPNSLPAILYAAASTSVPPNNKTSDAMEGSSNRLTHVFLENRMKSLEKELEEKDEDHSKKIRAIEQKSSGMCLHYEAHIKQLEEKISTLMSHLKSEKTLQEVESQLAKTKKDYEQLSEQFRKDLMEKDCEINKLKREKNARKSRMNAPVLQRDISKLREKLREKEKEISQLNKTVLLLQTGDVIPTKMNDKCVNDVIVSEKRYVDRAASPISTFYQPLVKSKILENDNARLQSKLDELFLELEERRLKFEAFEAKKLQEVRTLKEAHDKTLKTLEENHQAQLQKLRTEFLNEHSNSKVAELSAKVKGHELMIQHLKTCLQEFKLERAKYRTDELTEKSLREEIEKLKTDLHEERTFHTPEMHHYKSLETKARTLEARYFSREQDMQTMLEKNKHCSTIDVRHIEDKWRDILRNKDLQIQKFREELDDILETLQLLRTRGLFFSKALVSSS